MVIAQIDISWLLAMLYVISCYFARWWNIRKWVGVCVRVLVCVCVCVEWFRMFLIIFGSASCWTPTLKRWLQSNTFIAQCLTELVITDFIFKRKSTEKAKQNKNKIKNQNPIQNQNRIRSKAKKEMGNLKPKMRYENGNREWLSMISESFTVDC